MAAQLSSESYAAGGWKDFDEYRFISFRQCVRHAVVKQWNVKCQHETLSKFIKQISHITELGQISAITLQITGLGPSLLNWSEYYASLLATGSTVSELPTPLENNGYRKYNLCAQFKHHMYNSFISWAVLPVVKRLVIASDQPSNASHSAVQRTLAITR